jgi:hypothetical protein
MKRVILPGKNAHNISWYYEAKKLFAEFTFLKYDHWKNEPFDLKADLKKANDLFTEDTIIYAKSIGTIYALSSEKVLGRILCGLPLLTARIYGYDLLNALNNTKVKTIVFQRTNDPASKFELLKVKNPLVTVVELEGDNHDYDLTEIQRLAEKHKFFD